MLYRERGWCSPIPLGEPGVRARKAPVPRGTTGHDARVPTERVLDHWLTTCAANNIALHLADNIGVIGVDVDSYTSASGKVKSGEATIERLQAELECEFPPTFKVTARGLGASGIHFYRVPPGFEYLTKLKDVEIIQAKHRYAMVWPSEHPETGETVCWYAGARPDGSAHGRKIKSPPAVTDLPDLPKPILEYLLRASVAGLDKSAEISLDEARAWMDAHADSMCRAMRNTLGAECAKLADANSGARYDTARDAVMALVRLGAEGHLGTRVALSRTREAYFEALGADDGVGGRDGASEWTRLVVGAVAAVSGAQADFHAKGRCPDRADPNEGASVWPSPSQPRRVAEKLVAAHFTREGSSEVTLAHWRDDFYEWTGTHWRPVELAALSARCWATLDGAEFLGANSNVLDWSPTPTKIKAVIEALAALVHRDGSAEPDTGTERVACIGFANGVLHLDRASGARRLVAHSPGFFNLYCLGFDYDEDAPAPRLWEKFLASLELDADVIDLIQEWMGYVIAGDSSKSKLFYLYGATRAGKGVITRTLQRLIGMENTATPNLAAFAENFGLASVIGKSLISVNDARFRGVRTAEMVERLLNFTGGDAMNIPRKNRSDWFGIPSARVMIVSNDLPNVTGEQTSAFTKRILGPVYLHKSFYDAEDETLEDRLSAELGQILMWALDGYDRLCERGRFTRPKSSRLIFAEMEESISPVLGFLRAKCEVDPEGVVSKDRLYRAFVRWADDNHMYVPSKVEFGRQLRGIAPEFGVRKLVETRIATGKGHYARDTAWRGFVLADDDVDGVLL